MAAIALTASTFHQYPTRFLSGLISLTQCPIGNVNIRAGNPTLVHLNGDLRINYTALILLGVDLLCDFFLHIALARCHIHNFILLIEFVTQGRMGRRV